MPRKKRTTIEEVIPDSESAEDTGAVTDFDVSLEDVEDAEKLREVLDQFGESEVFFKVLRQDRTGSEYCYQTEVIDEDFIQKNFGGGDYIARVFIKGKYKKSIKLKISALEIISLFSELISINSKALIQQSSLLINPDNSQSMKHQPHSSVPFVNDFQNRMCKQCGFPVDDLTMHPIEQNAAQKTNDH